MARSSRRGLTRSCSRRMASMPTCITASLRGELYRRKRYSRKHQGLKPTQASPRGLKPQGLAAGYSPSLSSLAFSCQRIFCWRKEDEDRQIRGDAMKVVTGASHHKDDGPFLHCTGLIANLDNSLTAENVIDLIFSVGLLRVDGASR